MEIPSAFAMATASGHVTVREPTVAGNEPCPRSLIDPDELWVEATPPR